MIALWLWVSNLALFPWFCVCLPARLKPLSSGGGELSAATLYVNRPLDIDELYAKLKHQAKLTGHLPVFQGDILLDNRMVDYLAGRHDYRADGDSSASGLHRAKRAAKRSESCKWPNATVIYEFAQGYLPQAMMVARLAMEHWEQHTCIRFKRHGNETNYLSFVYTGSPSGCYSSVGMIGGEQQIKVGKSCGLAMGSIIHELGHAIGFWHEHSRPDRDRYIRVLPSNIQPGELSNFQKVSIQEADSLGTPYDYGSIMHYTEYAYSRHGGKTLQVLDSAYRGVLGQRKGLSPLDIQQANLLYGCVQPTTKPTFEPQLTSTINKGVPVALKLAGSRGSWMACNQWRCNVSRCPGHHGFLHPSTSRVCHHSVLALHPVTSRGKPLAVSDHVAVGDIHGNRFMVCGKVGTCRLSSLCRSHATGEFDQRTCGSHTLQVRVEGKSPGDYVQEGDPLVLEYSHSNQQWVGTSNGRTFRRLYTGYHQSRPNSIPTHHRRSSKTVFNIYKVTA